MDKDILNTVTYAVETIVFISKFAKTHIMQL